MTGKTGALIAGGAAAAGLGWYLYRRRKTTASAASSSGTGTPFTVEVGPPYRDNLVHFPGRR